MKEYSGIEENGEVKEGKVDCTKGCLKAFGIFMALAVGFLFLMYKVFIPSEYRHFTPKRTAYVEDLYQMDFDGATLKKFQHIPLGREYQLTLYTDDPKKLMEGFHGSSMEFVYEAPDGSLLQYRGSADGEHSIMVDFTPNDDKKGKYKGLFVYETDG
ncbi:MAG: hypothetical protein J5501_10595 [Ruminococcus sp.]|nr:hypothetical protein [Ruminococcus sp.]